MARIFDEPWAIGIIILAALLLFGAPKLPAIARSIGQSLRVFKTEVREIKQDASRRPTPDAPSQGTPASASKLEAPQEHVADFSAQRAAPLQNARQAEGQPSI